MDYDGIPLAFNIYPGNKSEQPTLKPLEKKIINAINSTRKIRMTRIVS